MPHITVTEREMSKVKNKIGIYSQLRKEVAPANLKVVITSIVEKAFREYANNRKGVTPDVVDRTWTGFNRYLQRYL